MRPAHIGYAGRPAERSCCHNVFAYFERLVDPYPEAVPPPAPQRLWDFLWANTQGVRRYVAVMTMLTALIGAFEALLFAFLGQIVDGLSSTAPAQWWPQEKARLFMLAAVLLASPLL